MSHYAVAVFANNENDFDDLLDPYGEERHFTRHVCDSEQLKEDYKKFLVLNPNWEQYGFDGYLEEHNYKREGNQIVSYYNDNAKWDWYTLDGKSYLFDLRDDVERYDTDALHHRKNDYVYVKNIPYAFITPDGVWHAPGLVGWFGMDTSTDESYKAYKKEWHDYVSDLSVNPYVSFVDCHI